MEETPRPRIGGDGPPSTQTAPSGAVSSKPKPSIAVSSVFVEMLLDFSNFANQISEFLEIVDGCLIIRKVSFNLTLPDEYDVTDTPNSDAPGRHEQSLVLPMMWFRRGRTLHQVEVVDEHTSTRLGVLPISQNQRLSAEVLALAGADFRTEALGRCSKSLNEVARAHFEVLTTSLLVTTELLPSMSASTARTAVDQFFNQAAKHGDSDKQFAAIQLQAFFEQHPYSRLVRAFSRWYVLMVRLPSESIASADKSALVSVKYRSVLRLENLDEPAERKTEKSSARIRTLIDRSARKRRFGKGATSLAVPCPLAKNADSYHLMVRGPDHFFVWAQGFRVRPLVSTGNTPMLPVHPGSHQEDYWDGTPLRDIYGKPSSPLRTAHLHARAQGCRNELWAKFHFVERPFGRTTWTLIVLVVQALFLLAFLGASIGQPDESNSGGTDIPALLLAAPALMLLPLGSSVIERDRSKTVIPRAVYAGVSVSLVVAVISSTAFAVGGSLRSAALTASVALVLLALVVVGRNAIFSHLAYRVARLVAENRSDEYTLDDYNELKQRQTTRKATAMYRSLKWAWRVPFESQERNPK